MTSTRALLAAALFLAPAGCVSLERPYPERTFYAIDATREGPKRPAAAAPKAVLRIAPCRVSPAFDTPKIVARLDASRYETDFYSEFFIAPGEMLTEEVREWLERSGLFGAVVGGGSELESGFVLETAVPPFGQRGGRKS